MMWHLVKSLSALLSKPFKDARKEFMKALTGARSLLWFLSGFVASDLGCEFDLGNVLKRVLHNFRRYGRRGEMAVLRRRHK